jgi:2,4-dichlorophenol 6-monooxygenase
VAAAHELSARTGVAIAAYVIGPGREVLDTYDDWVRLSEVEEDGCVLVRPDVHVGWRSRTLAADPAGALGDALARILGR